MQIEGITLICNAFVLHKYEFAPICGQLLRIALDAVLVFRLVENSKDIVNRGITHLENLLMFQECLDNYGTCKKQKATVFGGVALYCGEVAHNYLRSFV